MSAKLLPTFADRGCRVVSTADPHGRILGFLDLLLISATRSRVSLLIMLRHYATNRKVASSRPNEVNYFFNVPNPSSRSRPWGFSACNRNDY
jgi:hypothetical protein